jgi:ABC-type nickel/cobalt efflux system permease component RcnA
MNGLLIALIVLAAGATAYVLIRGVITMAQGKDISGQQSNKYMSMRVGLQALTILLVILLLVIGGRGLSGG